MAYSPQEKAEIVAQVAAKVAGNICCGNPDPNVYLATVETVHNDLVARIASATAAITVAAAETLVTQVFPGTTVHAGPGLVAPAPTPAPAPAPSPGPAYAPQVQAGPINAASNEESKWADALVNNPDNWHNNIGDKKSAAGPDFRHKTIQGPPDNHGKTWNIGLWIKSDKFSTRAPDWVFSHLGLDIPAGYSVS